MSNLLKRRDFLFRSGALGCSLAASPLVTPVAFAQAPWDMRLVVIILRGGMDGLDVVRPVGDPAFAALRPKRGRADALEAAKHVSGQQVMPVKRPVRSGLLRPPSGRLRRGGGSSCPRAGR